MRPRGERLTPERAAELMHVIEGRLYWKADFGRYKAGPVAFWSDRAGYLIVRIRSIDYKAHRLVWAITHGRFPTHHLDHINGVTCDNRVENLRECDQRGNQQNRFRNKNNKSGFPGVSYMARVKRWTASIVVNRKQLFLGNYLTPEEAHAAYVAAKAIHHTFEPVGRFSVEATT